MGRATERKLNRLRGWNVGVGLVLAAQAVLSAVLTNDFSLPVTATFMTGPPGSPSRLCHRFDVQVGRGVFIFLAISAGALPIIASPPVFGWHKANLLRSRNCGRWIEYFFSSSLTIVLIGMITGISDIAALLALFAVNAATILFGLLQEKHEQPGKPSWLPFWFGSFAGIIPWGAVVIHVWAPGIQASPPGFVYGIIITMFVLFNCFAVNTVLQYRQVGPWRDDLFGEKACIILSLTAKALLARHIFFPVLMSGKGASGGRDEVRRQTGPGRRPVGHRGDVRRCALDAASPSLPCYDVGDRTRRCSALSEETKMPRVSLDKPAPGFTLPDYSGRSVSLSDFRDRNNVLLVFNRTFT